MAINSGSSSLKFQLFQMPEEKLLVKGLFERINSDEDIDFSYTTNQEKKQIQLPLKTHYDAVVYLLDFLISHKMIDLLAEINGVGHRVAHGGEYFQKACLVEEKEVEEIKKLGQLAPLHNPVNLMGIQAFKEKLPTCPQIAVFDTSFHQTMAPKEYIYPIPLKYYQEDHIRKYGFHGTSHQYVGEKAADILGEKFEKLKIITCHLGNGASICGIKEGKSVITSMGFTPLAGLLMGTRCGDIDPSIVTFLQKEKGLSATEIEQVMNEESGLLGISEISNDSRDLIAAAEKGNSQAILALDIFTSRVKQTIGAYAAELGGVDAVVFTAGIGENSSYIRKNCCEGLGFIGIELDKKNNEENATVISQSGSNTFVMVIPTNEESMIAQETLQLIK